MGSHSPRHCNDSVRLFTKQGFCRNGAGVSAISPGGRIGGVKVGLDDDLLSLDGIFLKEFYGFSHAGLPVPGPDKRDNGFLIGMGQRHREPRMCAGRHGDKPHR